MAAAAEVEFAWEAESLGDRPHSAVPDARACQAVWLYLHDPQLRAGIEALQAQRAQAQAAYWRQQDRDRQRCAGLARFIDHWWLGRSGPPIGRLGAQIAPTN